MIYLKIFMIGCIVASTVCLMIMFYHLFCMEYYSLKVRWLTWQLKKLEEERSWLNQ